MATIVYQGFPSSFVDPLQKGEPPLVPPLPLTMRLKLSSPKPADLGGWSFLQYSLSSTDNSPQESVPTIVRRDACAPPPARQSSLKLSERSLQLCTENLGSETGTDVSEGDSLFSNVRNSEFPTKSPAAVTRQRSGGRKVNPPRDIPPPLTTLRGAETLQVKVQREEGRLVINSVKSPSKSPCLRAERIDGRLRLSLVHTDSSHVTDIPKSCDRERTNKLQESEPDVEDQNPPAGTDAEYSHGAAGKGPGNGNGARDGEHSEKHQEYSLPPGEEDRQDHQGGENTTGKLIQRPVVRIRCNEGEHDDHHHQSKMLHWEQLWVATS